MSNVIVDKNKIDILANAISCKSGEPVTMTLDEMVSAVDGIDTSDPTLETVTKTYTPSTSAVTDTITASAGYDGIEEVDVTVSAIPIASPYIYTTSVYSTENNHRVFKTRGAVSVDNFEGDNEGYINEGIYYGNYDTYNAIAKNTSVTPTESAQTIGGGNYMMEGAVTVNAIPSNYVGSGITQRSSSDLTASGATVSVPSGYYASNASKSIADGSLGPYTSSNNTKTSSYFYATKTYPAFSAGYFSSMPDQTITLALENKSCTPSQNEQVITPTNINCYLNSVTVSAMPTGTAGTPTATKGTVSNHSISVTPSVTNTEGYISGGTHTGTAVSVSASELVSGTYTVDSSGTKDVTNYASASVPSGTAGTPSASKGAVSNHQVTVTPSVTNTTGWITGSTKTGTGVTVTASELASGNKEITSNGTGIDVVGYSTVSVAVSGGGGSSMSIGVTGFEPSTVASTYSIGGLLGEPTSFVVLANNDITPNSSYNYVASIVYDGSSSGNAFGDIITNTSNAQVTYSSNLASFGYYSGGLTINLSGAYFGTFEYILIYTYGGGVVDTKDVQVGSGATSITFTGLEDEPAYWSCAFKSNFSTSSGYQRVITVATDGTYTVGSEMDSSAHIAQHWTSSYSNGSLTITSNGTNQGGYFHQPGYYQLTYAYDATGNYQSKTVTPTTSQQVVEADSGYDALKKVTVNAIPSTYVQPTSTVGATTYRASTSSQTIASGTYHSAAATIAAVSQTNLTAENIKSGTTISISNGQSNLWSVTGSYTGGGGGTLTVATKTTTLNATSQTLTFSSLSGQPKYWFLRATTNVSSSGSTTYYYVTDCFYDGTNIKGNCFRIGSTRRVQNITSGISQSYSGGTLTITAGSSSGATPGQFYGASNFGYELVYVY